MKRECKWPVRVKTLITDDIKFKRFCRLLFPNNEDHHKLICLGLLVRMWCATMLHHPDGILNGWTDEDLAMYMEWDGDVKALITALSQCGDKGGNGFILKNGTDWEVWHWKEYQNDPLGTLDRYSENNKKKYSKQVGTPDIITPQDQTVARFLMLAQKLKMPNAISSLRTWIEGRNAQEHLQKLEEVLSNMGNVGHSYIILDKMYFNGTMERAQRDFQKEAIEAAKREVEANDIR